MKQVAHINDERRVLSSVKHTFLVWFWGTWQDWRNLYMVMDFVEGGELFSLLRKSRVISANLSFSISCRSSANVNMTM
jgi:protein kinase A